MIFWLFHHSWPQYFFLHPVSLLSLDVNYVNVMDNTFFQLLQEVSTLGRDPKYIGFKMGAKPDNTEVDSNSVLGHASGRVAPVTEEPMSDEEDDDEDRFSFTSTTSTAKVLAENDKNKDNSKYDRLS